MRLPLPTAETLTVILDGQGYAFHLWLDWRVTEPLGWLPGWRVSGTLVASALLPLRQYRS
jgi:hypothetical protein